jgi:hypothetical protein
MPTEAHHREAEHRRLPDDAGDSACSSGTAPLQRVKMAACCPGYLNRCAIVANISKLLRSLNKPLLAKLPFFVGC